MDALAQAIEALLGPAAAAKVCAVFGVAFVLFGWLRGKGGRAAGRAIIALSDEEDHGERLRAHDERIDDLERDVSEIQRRLNWPQQRLR